MNDYSTHRRSFLLAYCLWFFLGLLGIHRFYLGRPLTGLLWFATGGLLGVGWIFDFFWTAVMVNDENHEARFGVHYGRPAYGQPAW
jgi:TM2 domain-containing membrane protein YozV